MKDIIKVLDLSNKISIFVHTSADGDALGSAFALKTVLESKGKVAHLYLDEKISQRLEFLNLYCDCEYFTNVPEQEYDLAVALDCGDISRVGKFRDYYSNHFNTINIDHHFTNNNFATYNYVDGNAAATGEIIANILLEMGFAINSNIASLLYTAISSDTGCFAYSNATQKTHNTVAKLLEHNIDSAKINRLLFDTVSLVELKLKAYVINNLKLFNRNKLAIAVVTEVDLKNYNASYENTEGLVDTLRSIKDVEIGCLIKEKDGMTKGSIRTNSYVDATLIAAHFGGGGHKRASGFSTNYSVETVIDEIVKITDKVLREEN